VDFQMQTPFLEIVSGVHFGTRNQLRSGLGVAIVDVGQAPAFGNLQAEWRPECLARL